MSGLTCVWFTHFTFCGQVVSVALQQEWHWSGASDDPGQPGILQMTQLSSVATHMVVGGDNPTMRAIDDALSYPTEDDDWIKTVLIGGVLTFFGFLIIPIMLVYGYLVNVIRRTTAGDPEPPEFEEWGQLLTDGAQGFIIVFVYMLIPLIVAVVTVGGAMLAFFTGGEAGAFAGLGTILFGMFLTFVLSLVFGYIAGAAFVNFAREGEIGAGFDFGTLTAVMFDSSYIIAWLIAAAVLIGAGIINAILGSIPMIGSFLGAFVMFYAMVVGITLLADGFDDAMEGPDIEAEVEGADTAV